MGLLDILKQYANPNSVQPDRVQDHFGEVAQQSTPQDIGGALASAFRSDATPPFGQMIGDLFSRSDPQQRAGILNQIVQSIGPGALASVGGGALGRILGGASGSAGVPATITPAQAAQVTPADAGAIAAHAEQQDGSIIDKAAAFYAEHPTLVKSIGAGALAILLGKMHSNN